MTGMFLGMTKKEYESVHRLNWEYVKSCKGRWESFNFEESSIDLGVSCEPRLIVDDIEYRAIHQYFIKNGETVTRLMVGVEIPIPVSPPVYRGTALAPKKDKTKVNP